MTENSGQTRSKQTRQSMMRALEKLGAKHGLENVTVKAILEESGQKNASALQYHFGNRQGLILAVFIARTNEARTKRAELFRELLAQRGTLSLRELWRVWMEPVFMLARANPDFRRYVKTFAQHYAFSEQPLEEETGGSREHEILMGNMLRECLGHLDEPIARARTLAVTRFIALSMALHSREPRAFRGPQSDIFLNNLIDEATGMFTIEESEETRAAIAASEQNVTQLKRSLR